MGVIGVSAFDLGIKDQQRVDPWIYLMAKKRTLFLSGLIDESDGVITAGVPTPHMAVPFIVDFMLALDAQDHDPIKLFINSPGGDIELGLTLYHTMQSISSPVYTIGRGTCASMAAILLSAGAEGHRYALPSCRMMLHLARGATGAGTKQEREKRERVLQEYEKRVAEIIIKHCRKTNYTPDQILQEWQDENELWMFAEKALEYGLIDTVVTPDVFRQEISSD